MDRLFILVPISCGAESNATAVLTSHGDVRSYCLNFPSNAAIASPVYILVPS